MATVTNYWRELRQTAIMEKRLSRTRRRTSDDEMQRESGRARARGRAMIVTQISSRASSDSTSRLEPPSRPVKYTVNISSPSIRLCGYANEDSNTIPIPTRSHPIQESRHWPRTTIILIHHLGTSLSFDRHLYSIHALSGALTMPLTVVPGVLSSEI